MIKCMFPKRKSMVTVKEVGVGRERSKENRSWGKIAWPSAFSVEIERRGEFG